MSVAVREIPGSGTAVSGGAYADTWAHGLGIATPAVSLYELTAASPAQWRLVPQGEYDARFPTADTVTLALASTPPTPGHVGALKLVVAGQLAIAPAPVDASPAAGGISQMMFRSFLSQATDFVQAFLATVIRFDGDPTEVTAARWHLTKSVKTEAAGFLPECDIVFRVRLDALPAVTIKPDVTRIVEFGKPYRVARIRSANGDPALVLECTAD
jgi:hypothetical protein